MKYAKRYIASDKAREIKRAETRARKQPVPSGLELRPIVIAEFTIKRNYRGLLSIWRCYYIRWACCVLYARGINKN